MSNLSVNTITNAAGGNTAQINGMTPTGLSLQGFRNRLFNGNMLISQRSGAASVTVDGANVVNPDRWTNTEIGNGAFTAQQITDAPDGFTNSVRVTVTTAQTGTLNAVTRQSIEGLNIADLGWGTANAKPVVLSFWTKSSLTGSFGGALRNGNGDRAYPFSYTISAANTWEYKTITVPGETTGTWTTDNTVGVTVWFSHGTSSTGTAGAWAASDARAPTGSVFIIQTLNATWQITGVQLEAGAVATPFERRPFGAELALCQRYYFKMQATGANAFFGVGLSVSTTIANGIIQFPVSLRTAPAALEQSGTAGHYQVANAAANIVCTGVPTFAGAELFSARVNFTTGGSLVAGQANIIRSVNSSAFLAWSAEL